MFAILIIIVIFTASIPAYSGNKKANTFDYEYTYLKRLDIPKDVALYRVLKDFLSEQQSESEKMKYYSVFLKTDNNVTTVCITIEDSEILYVGINQLIGYFELEDKIFIFSKDGNISPNYKYAVPETNLKVKTTDKLTFNGRDDREWVYYIMKNYYARWLYRFDLLWYIPEGKKVTSDKFLLTAPKRTSK